MENLNLTEAFKRGLEQETHISIDIDITDNWDESVLHVSDLRFAADDCPRALKLRMTGAEKQKPTMGQKIMWRTGHVQEELTKQRICAGLINESWQAIPGTFIKDRQVFKNLPNDISGQYDMVLISANKEPYSFCVVDIKTVRGGAFHWLDVEGARPGNIAQVRGYMHALNVDMGKLFYIDREGQNAVREFDVERNDAWVEQSYEWLRNIRDSKELPPLMPLKLIVKQLKTQETLCLNYPFQCGYCEYNGVSCPGAGELPEKFKRISKSKKIGDVKDGELHVVDEFKELKNMITTLYQVEKSVKE